MKSLSCVRLFATPWTVAYQAPPSMGFSRQESWNGLPFPSPGDLPNSGIEPWCPTLQADTLTSELPGKPFYKGTGTYSGFFLEVACPHSVLTLSPPFLLPFVCALKAAQKCPLPCTVLELLKKQE